MYVTQNIERYLNECVLNVVDLSLLTQNFSEREISEAESKGWIVREDGLYEDYGNRSDAQEYPCSHRIDRRALRAHQDLQEVTVTVKVGALFAARDALKTQQRVLRELRATAREKCLSTEVERLTKKLQVLQDAEQVFSQLVEKL